MTTTTAPLRLSEQFVQDCFHSYLKSSLTQAKVERLVPTELLSSAEGDLMITGKHSRILQSATRKILVLNKFSPLTRSRTLPVLCGPEMYDQPTIRSPSEAKEQSRRPRRDHRPIRRQLSHCLPLLPPCLGRHRASDSESRARAPA